MERAKKEVFVIGDSISIHYGPYLQKMLCDQYHYNRKGNTDEALKDLDNPVGANGGDSGLVLEYLRKENEDGRRYDILLINCGLHDIKVDAYSKKVQTEEQRYRTNLEKIVRLGKAMSEKLIWIHSTPVSDKTHNTGRVSFLRFNRNLVQYNAVAAEIMNKHGVPIIDLYSFTKSLGEAIYCDHVHYTQEVRALQGAYIAGYLSGAETGVL